MAVMNTMLHTPIHGAYTELFAGLSPDVTIEKTGAWSKFYLKVLDKNENKRKDNS